MLASARIAKPVLGRGVDALFSHHLRNFPTCECSCVQLKILAAVYSTQKNVQETFEVQMCPRVPEQSQTLICMHNPIHTYIHTYIHYIHSYIHTFIHSYIHTFIH